LSSFRHGAGTLIAVDRVNEMERVAFNRDEAKSTVVGVPDIPEIAS